MNKTALAPSVALIVLIAFANFGYAIEVSSISESIQSNSAEITKLNAELNAKLQQVNVKLDNFATKQDVTDLLTAHLIKTNELNERFRGILTVSFIIIGMAFLGLGYSIYFYFKGKGRT